MLVLLHSFFGGGEWVVFLHYDIVLKLILTSWVGNMFYSCTCIIKMCIHTWGIHRSILSVLIPFYIFFVLGNSAMPFGIYL